MHNMEPHVMEAVELLDRLWHAAMHGDAKARAFLPLFSHWVAHHLDDARRAAQSQTLTR